MNSYELSRPALLDMYEIVTHREEQSGSVFAADLQEELIAAFERIAATPGLGHRRTDLTPRNCLFYTSGSYLIVFVPHTDPLSIVAVLHGSRDVRRILQMKHRWAR